MDKRTDSAKSRLFSVPDYTKSVPWYAPFVLEDSAEILIVDYTTKLLIATQNQNWHGPWTIDCSSNRHRTKKNS